MKKIIISVSVIFIFITGFRGCENNYVLFDFFLHALNTAILYDKGEGGFAEKYYVTGGENGRVFTNTDPVSDFWVERKSGTGNNLNAIKSTPRLDTAIVYAVGDNGTIIRSPDRGIDWTLLVSPTTRNLNGLDFTSFTSIFVVGDSGLILRSTNSGVNWTILNSGVTKKLNSIYCNSFNQAITVGEKGTILRTTNFGANWQNVSLQDTSIDLNKIGYGGFTTQTGIIACIVGDKGNVFQSSDFVTWNLLITGTTRNIRDFYFNGNATEGFVTGDSGTVLYTTNSGINWSQDFFLLSLTDQNITAGVRVNDSTFAGIAGNEFILISANETILPAEFASFSSSVKNNDVNLSWVTTREQNNRGFEVERSLSDKTEWTKAGYIKGNGTTSESNQYSFTDRDLQTGKYYYRLKQIDFNGNYEYHNLNNEVNIASPVKFTLSQNYPNPFNPETKIDFELPAEGNVNVKIYDVSGKLISSLVNEHKSAGYYSVDFNAGNLSSGVYFYRMEYNSAGNVQHSVRKMLFAK